MSRVLMVIGLVCVVSFLAWAGEAADSSLVVGDFKITLPASWQKTGTNTRSPGVVAKRYEKQGEAQVPIGEIMAAELKGSVAKESGEMESSAGTGSKIIKLLEAAEFTGKGGIKGRKVVFTVMAKDPDYGSPLIFYSIYLPKADGSSVTFKLRCGSAKQEALGKEFENIVSGATAVTATGKPTDSDKK